MPASTVDGSEIRSAVIFIRIYNHIYSIITDATDAGIAAGLKCWTKTNSIVHVVSNSCSHFSILNLEFFSFLSSPCGCNMPINTITKNYA